MIRSTIMLSKKLESYRYEIEKTVKPFLKIETINEKPHIYHSKFAGHPYLPKTAEHPLDENGKPMKLLAQLNFAKIPHLEHMPQKGLLQFFIAADDDLLGLDFDDQTKQNNFRVVYFPEVITDESLLVSDFSYIQEVEESYFPIEKELSLSFTVGKEPVAMGDHRFDHSYSNLDLDEVIDGGGERNETLWDLFAEELSNEGHKIGGYGYFTQSDPRDYDEKWKSHDILLLQIDSESEKGIMWGDSGVANFFIRKQDLERLDFSNVLYNWDCF